MNDERDKAGKEAGASCASGWDHPRSGGRDGNALTRDSRVGDIREEVEEGEARPTSRGLSNRPPARRPFNS